MKSVLCVIDPTSADQPALRRAVWFAKKTMAHLELIICDYDRFRSGYGISGTQGLQRARARFMDLHYDLLSELAYDNRDSGLEISTTAVWDHPLHEGIVRYACASGAEIVFKDTHPHPGLGLSGLSNTDWSLIRTCPMPLWLVKPYDFPETPKLIAAVDPLQENDKPAALDDRILRLTQSIADATGSDLHVFHSFDATMHPPPLTTSVLAPILTPTLIVEERRRQRHLESLEKIAKEHRIAMDRTHLATGPTSKTLPTLVTGLHASLVVMGAVARSKLQRLFIGSTTERMLEQIACDLLVVKPDGFKTPVPLDVDNVA